MLVFVMSGTMSQVAAWLTYLARKCGNRTTKQIYDEGCFGFPMKILRNYPLTLDPFRVIISYYKAVYTRPTQI